jgi:hypothetical protein
MGVFSSQSFVCGGSFATPSCGPRPLEALTSRRSQGTRVGHTNSFRRRITRLDRSRSSASTQRHLTSATEHERALTTREFALRAVATGWRRPTRPELPTTEAPCAGSSSGESALPCRGRLARRGHTSRHVPHSAAPQARRPTVRAVVDRKAARRQARRDDARPQSPYRPREQAASFSGRSGQPRVDSTTQSSLLVNAGLSCVDEGDHGTGRVLEGERERAMSPVAPVIARMSMDTPRRQSSRSLDCWHVRRRVKSSHKPPWSRIIRLKRAANESRHLRAILVREPTRRVDR